MIAAPLTHNNPNYADEMSLCLCLVVNSNIPLFILNGTPPMRYQAEKMYVEFHISKFETIILSLSLFINDLWIEIPILNREIMFKWRGFVSGLNNYVVLFFLCSICHQTHTTYKNMAHSVNHLAKSNAGFRRVHFGYMTLIT